jgi:hypothetical protein
MESKNQSFGCYILSAFRELSVTFSDAGTVIEIIQRVATAVIPGIDQANAYAGKKLYKQAREVIFVIRCSLFFPLPAPFNEKQEAEITAG